MNKFIFVCTGNTCRSPLAESYARMKYPDKEISSRGLFVMDRNTNGLSLSIIEENGLSAASEPEQLTEADIKSAKLLVMGKSHKDAILSEWPDADVQLVSEYAGDGAVDIPDPYGGTQAQYEEVFAHLKKHIDKFKW